MVASSFFVSFYYYYFNWQNEFRLCRHKGLDVRRGWGGGNGTGGMWWRDASIDSMSKPLQMCDNLTYDVHGWVGGFSAMGVVGNIVDCTLTCNVWVQGSIFCIFADTTLPY